MAHLSSVEADLSASFACPVSEVCGGCPLLHRSRAEQLRIKADRVDGAILARFEKDGRHGEGAHILARAARHLRAGSSLVGYRHRIRLQVTPLGFGFFNAAKAGGCAVLAPALESLLHELQACTAGMEQLLGAADYAELRAPDSRGLAGLLLTARQGYFTEAQRATEALRRAWQRRGHGELIVHTQAARQDVHGGRSLAPVQRLRGAIHTQIDVPLDAFVQINPEVSLCLVSDVVVHALELGVRRFADLFCGAGNFAIPLARAIKDAERGGGRTVKGAPHWAVEAHRGAVSSARRSIETQGLADEIDFASFDLRAQFEWPNQEVPFDLVVANPPRAGLREALSFVASAARRHLVLIACDPKGLANDLIRLTDEGFSLESLTLYDMFPGTDHVETVAWLAR